MSPSRFVILSEVAPNNAQSNRLVILSEVAPSNAQSNRFVILSGALASLFFDPRIFADRASP
jgi:hypothetical protein